MKGKRLEDITNPIVNPLGEVIYEIFGRNVELGGTSKQSVAYVRLPPKKSSAAHYHKVSEESYLITRGKGIMVVDGESIEVKKGDSYLIMPGKVHQIFNRDKRTKLEFYVISAPAWTIDDSFV